MLSENWKRAFQNLPNSVAWYPLLATLVCHINMINIHVDFLPSYISLCVGCHMCSESELEKHKVSSSLIFSMETPHVNGNLLVFKFDCINNRHSLGINLKSPWSSSTCVIKGLCNLHFSHQMNAQLIHASVSCEFCTQLKCTLLHLSWQWCHKIFLETHQKPHWPPIIAVHFLLISGRWSVIIHHLESGVTSMKRFFAS